MAEVIREIRQHASGPILVLKRKSNPDGWGFAIKLQDAWKFSEEHNPNFVLAVTSAAQQAYDLLGMGTLAAAGRLHSRRLAEVAAVIQDGIDDLMKVAPLEKERKVVGEGRMFINGDKSHDFEVTQ